MPEKNPYRAAIDAALAVPLIVSKEYWMIQQVVVDKTSMFVTPNERDKNPGVRRPKNERPLRIESCQYTRRCGRSISYIYPKHFAQSWMLTM